MYDNYFEISYNNHMKYSIIIPVHNAESTITRCVESVVSQNVDLQVILIENGSSDRSANECEILSQKYNCVEYYQSKLSGVSYARNIGLDKAEGDIIGFCDADDYYEPNSLKKVSKIFEQYEIDIVYMALYIVNNGTHTLRSVKRERIINSFEAIDNVVCNPCVMGSVGNKFFKKKLIEQHRFSDELSYLEDGYFNVEILNDNKNIKIYLSKEPGYNYVENINSATNNFQKLFDENNKLKYVNALQKMLSLPGMRCKEKWYIKAAIFRIVVENIGSSYVKENMEIYNNLYSDTKKYILSYIICLFSYDIKHKIKLLLIGGKVLIEGKNKGITCNSSR